MVIALLLYFLFLKQCFFFLIVCEIKCQKFTVATNLRVYALFI